MTQQVTMKEAKKLIKEKKLTFIDFFTTWCYPCGVLSDRIEKSSAMFKNNDNIAFVKVNIDENKETAAWATTCGMTVIPTIAVFVNGNQIKLDYTKDGTKLKGQQCLVGNFDEAITTIKAIIKQHA